jgi:hypothetical protein
MALKLKEEFGMALYITNLMEDDMSMNLELPMFSSNVREQVCDILDGFLLFLMKYEKKKTHNILFLMLNPRFKNFKLVSFL